MRWLRRALAVLLSVLGLALVTTLGAARTATVHEWLRPRVVAALRDAGVDVAIGRIGGDLVRTVELENVRLLAGGRTFAHVPRIELRYALLPLLRGRVRLVRVAVTAPRVRLERAGGAWRLPDVLTASSGGGIPVDIRQLEVRGGRLAVALRDADPPRRFAATGLDLDGSVSTSDVRTDITVTSLRLVPRGIAVSALTLTVRAAVEADGTVRVPELVLATERSHASGEAAVTPGAAAHVHAELAPLAAREIRAIVPASGLLADVAGTLDVDGPWRHLAGGVRADLGPAGQLRANGVADLASEPARYGVRVAVTALDPGGVVAGAARGAVTARARARAHGLGLEGQLSYDAAVGPSELAGWTIDAGRLRGDGGHGRHRVRGRVRSPAGDLVVRAGLRMSTPLAYRAAVRARVARLEAVVPDVPGRFVARATLAGRGTETASRHAVLRARIADASIRGVDVVRGDLDAALDGESLRLGGLRLEGPAFAAGASGTADLAQRRVDATLDARADLRRIGEQMGTALAGTARASAVANGAFDALAVRATANVDGARYGGASAEKATCAVDARGIGGAAPSATATASAQRLRTADDGIPHQVTARVEWRRTAGADRATVDADARAEDGRVDRVALAITREDGRLKGELRELVASPADGPPWRLARPAAIVVDDGIETPGMTLAADGQEIAVSGRVANRGASTATLALRRVRTGPLCTLAHAGRCSGTFDGTVRVTGSGAAPVIDASLTGSDLHVEEVEYGALALTARYAEQAARVRVSLDHPQAGTVNADGTVPVDLAWTRPRADVSARPVDLRVRADGLDLRFVRALAPGPLRESAGRLTVDVRVSGPLRALRADGPIRMIDGRFLLAATGVPYEDVQVDAAASGTILDVRRLHAKSGDGTLDGRGQLALAPDAPATVGIELELADFLVARRPEGEAAVGGRIDVTGTAAAPVVKAKLDVAHAVFRPAVLPTSSAAPRPDPTIVVVGGVAEALPPPAPPTPALAEAMTVDAVVRIANNTWVRRPDADIELGGEVHVTRSPGAPPRIVGQIRLVRGWYAFQGRRFGLEEGRITFTGATPPDPTLDVTATYRSGEYVVTVRVAGTAEKPTLTLSSEPALDQADVLAVILYGKPARSLGKNESVGLQQQALQLAAGYVMPELRTSVMNALGVDTLEVQMPGDSTTPGRVSAGRYVAEDVFVSIAQEFGARVAQVVGIEYAVTRSISVKASTSTRGDSALDLFWRHRY